MKYVLVNTFSPNMAKTKDYILDSTGIEKEEIPSTVEIESYIGHVDTAAVLSSELGFPVPMNREAVKLEEGDIAFVAQLVWPGGGRLPEGATTLPNGARFDYSRIIIHYKH